MSPMFRLIHLTRFSCCIMIVAGCKKPSIEDLRIVSIQKKERISRYEIRYTCNVILNNTCEEVMGSSVSGSSDPSEKRTYIIKFTGLKHGMNCKGTSIETSAQAYVDFDINGGFPPAPTIPVDTGVYTLYFVSGNAQFFTDTVHIK
jgi:hypothetical protein